MTSGWDTEDLVDLGEDFDVPASEPWAGSRWSVVWRFRLVVPICAALFLLAASVSAPAAPLRLVSRVAVGSDASIMIEGTDLYVYDLAGAHNELRSFELGSGRLRWFATPLEIPSQSTMRYLDGLVILSMADTDRGGEHTVALDAATGRRVWSSDLGFAVVVAGGVLVSGTPPPAGYNYPGTTPSSTFRLLDPRTGKTRWEVGVGVNCDTDVAGLADLMLELCSNTSQLASINLSDGSVRQSRQVDLGDPAQDFGLPQFDRMAAPQLFVVGDTALIAHAAPSSPAVDAYAIDDLRPRWSGMDASAGIDLVQCGTALCAFQNGLNGTVLNLHTGKTTKAIPPAYEGAPVDGALVLTSVTGTLNRNDVAVLPTAPEGVSEDLSAAGDAHEVTPAGAALWLTRWHVTATNAVRDPTRIEILHDITARSCVQVAGYVACAAADNRLSLWRL